MIKQQFDNDNKNIQPANNNKILFTYQTPKLDILNFDVTETAGTNIVESDNGFMS